MNGANHDPNTMPPTPSQQPTDSNPYPFYQAAPSLATSRYNRQLLIPQISLTGQQRLSRAKILIIGLGGLGSPASLYLAGSGIHTLGLLDHDVVEQSNLHRQIVHCESSIGQSKVVSALKACRDLNREVNYIAHEVAITGQNALEIIGRYDLVLDCTDNPATRYLISDCCVLLGKTLVSGAAQKLDGQVVVLNWPIYAQNETRTVSGRGPCYRCVFPHPPSPEMVKSCSEIGILGPVVGAIGTLMASEAIRLIVQEGRHERKPTMLLYNAWPSDPRTMFRVIGLRGKRKDCVVCGEDSTLAEKGLTRLSVTSIREGSMDYETWCGRVEDVMILRDDERVAADEFLARISQPQGEKPLLVDVREEFEVELGSKVEGSINVPISRILRSDGPVTNGAKQADDWDVMVEASKERSVYFLCQRGNDSQIAAKKLMDRVTQRMELQSPDVPGTKRWIGDVKGGLLALDKITRSV